IFGVGGVPNMQETDEGEGPTLPTAVMPGIAQQTRHCKKSTSATAMDAPVAANRNLSEQIYSY
ncbi:hypothetical protein HDU78_000753, partial [Chytriomyces hyalinus]